MTTLLLSPGWQADSPLPICLEHLYDTKVGSDVRFVIGEKRDVLMGHRSILICRSPVFCDLLTSQKPDPVLTEWSVQVANTPKNIFNIFLRYLYTDQVAVEMTEYLAKALFRLAQVYHVNTLVSHCKEFLNSTAGSVKTSVAMEDNMGDVSKGFDGRQYDSMGHVSKVIHAKPNPIGRVLQSTNDNNMYFLSAIDKSCDGTGNRSRTTDGVLPQTSQKRTDSVIRETCSRDTIESQTEDIKDDILDHTVNTTQSSETIDGQTHHIKVEVEEGSSDHTDLTENTSQNSALVNPRVRNQKDNQNVTSEDSREVDKRYNENTSQNVNENQMHPLRIKKEILEESFDQPSTTSQGVGVVLENLEDGSYVYPDNISQNRNENLEQNIKKEVPNETMDIEIPDDRNYTVSSEEMESAAEQNVGKETATDRYYSESECMAMETREDGTDVENTCQPVNKVQVLRVQKGVFLARPTPNKESNPEMSRPPTKRRRVELSLDDKIRLIADAQTLPKPTHKELSERYGVGKSTVSDIMKRKDIYVKNIEETSNGNKFRCATTTKFEKLNDLMWNWFRQAREKSIPLSGSIMLQKSQDLAAQLDITDFKASNGWLEKFKIRHSITSFKVKVSDESASVVEKLVGIYRQQLYGICDGYDKCDIFNCDETGLYFRALPDKMSSQEGASAKRVKNSKERLTVMFACSAAGEKLPPLVIGNVKQPRCFGNLNSNRMPLTWKHNRKAWMDGHIFGDWIKSVDRGMKREKRKILMFLDNATSHTKDMKLDNVTLKFLSTNCTSLLQPLDQGIIRAFKVRYRSKMIRRMLSEIDRVDRVSEIELCKHISVLDALFWIRDSWNETCTETIKKCFADFGFSLSRPASTNDNVGDDDADDDDDYADDNANDDDDIPLAQLLHIAPTANIDENTLVSFDDDVPIEDDGDDWEETLTVDDDEDSEDQPDPTPSPSELLTLSEIAQFSRRLENHAVMKDARFLNIAHDLRALTEDIVVRDQCRKKHSTMDTFLLKR